ncbi:unnamed protein product [marine sediment metagenome]|uniref:Uncharacterized protein n=1 Tax=marine sediment metagenome TaxID=412755 RepID=X0SGT6_9ZZZZ
MIKLSYEEKVVLAIVCLIPLAILFLTVFIAYGQEPSPPGTTSSTFAVYESGSLVIPVYTVKTRLGLDGKYHYEVFPYAKPVLPAYIIKPSGQIFSGGNLVLPVKELSK